MQAFSLSAQFARESAMLKLPEERRWGESKGAGIFFLSSPSPLSFFRPRTYREGYYFYSPQSSTVIKSKMAATKIFRTRTRFRPPKIRLHCRLDIEKLIFQSGQRPTLSVNLRPKIVGLTAPKLWNSIPNSIFQGFLKIALEN